MKTDGSPLDIFFQKLPLSTALFDQQLILRRCNSTWVNYIDGISPVGGEPGRALYDILPGIETAVQAYIDRVLGGEVTAVESLRLNSDNKIFYWDASFIPWVEGENVTGFLLFVADVTERALSRQILERKVEDRTQKLSALYDVMTIAGKPLALEDKLEQSLGRVLAAVHAQAGIIQILDRKSEFLFLVAHQGFPQSVTNALSVMPVNAGLSGWTSKQQQPLVLADLTADERSSDLIRQSGFKAFASVQMTTGGRILGVLSVYRQTKRPYSQEDVSLLNSVADQIGTAIKNAKLSRENEHLLIVEERNRLARELHDAVTQSLYSLTLHAETSMRFIQAKQLDMAGDYIEQVAETARQALREMRLLLHNLRPAVLEQMGLVKAVRQRIEAVEKRVGVLVDYQVEGEIDLPAPVEEALYHIVQEALNNALKHAAATKIDLSLRQQGDQVSLVISDNGTGFNLLQSSDSGGLGLSSMRERVNILGGDLEIDTVIDQGSTIQVKIDLDQLGELPDALDVLDLL